MSKVRRILLLELFFSLAFAVVLIFLYEQDFLMPGYASEKNALQYVLQAVMEVLTIGLIPLSLYLFKIKRVAAQLKSQGYQGLLRWGSLRMTMLCLPLIINTVLYYAFMSVAFGYMAIILLLCLYFVYPSKTRCREEIGD